jgi:peptidyl-dipeptidase Dcp
MQALVDKQGGGFKLEPWDWQYYAEQVRKAEYDLDQAQIRPYFELDNVLKNGVFYAANRMYGITFRERKDIPVYQPDVRVFEVFDKGGKPLALWYCDYFKRDNKNGGAWEDTFVDQSGLLGTKTVVYNVANFQKPAPGQPALLTFDDVTTMFHEFGHALHAIFSNVQYPTFSGTATPRDFVEFPSQFNEHWALEPSVFAHYAKHHQTGAPMPQAMVDRIKAARTFNQGFLTTEYLAAALLDLAWHAQPAGAAAPDVGAFEKAALEKYGVAMREVPPRYRTPYFAHIWGGGYAAAYYAYMWSEVVDDDAYAWFMEHGGMTASNGQRFRDLVLSRGGTMDAAAMYRAFAGRDPRIEPLMEQRGLVTTPVK